MKALRLLLALTLAWLLCASKSRADAFGNRAWGKSAYQSVITPDDEWQTLVRYRENPTGYDETASGQEVWTKFDPLGLETESEYDQDAENARKEATREDSDIQKKYNNGEYGKPDSPEAQAKALALTQDENAQRDRKIAADAQGKANLQSTAKWARDHNIKVDEATLDDDPGHSSAVGPGISSVMGVDSPRDPPSAGQAQYAAIRGAITKAGAEEVVKQAAIMMATDDLGGFFEGAKYTPKVVKQMADGTDLYHGFPSLVDASGEAGTVRTIVGGDGVTREVLEIPGSVNGKDGVYQYIKNPDGTINHRLFVPNKP